MTAQGEPGSLEERVRAHAVSIDSGVAPAEVLGRMQRTFRDAPPGPYTARIRIALAEMTVRLVAKLEEGGSARSLANDSSKLRNVEICVVQAGYELFDSNRRLEAVGLLESMDRMFPRGELSAYRAGVLAEFLHRARRYTDALRVIARLLPQATGSDRCELLQRRCSIECSLGRTESAHATCDEIRAALAETPGIEPAVRINAKLALANAFLITRRYQDVVRMFEGAVSLDDPPTDAAELKRVLALGFGYSGARRTHDLATRCFEIVSEHGDPEDRATARVKLAELSLIHREVDRALRWLDSSGADPDRSAHACSLATEIALQRLERDEAGAMKSVRDRLAPQRRSFADLLDAWSRAPSDIGFLQLDTRLDVLATLVGLELRCDAERGGERAFGHVLAAQTMSSCARAVHATTPDLATVRSQCLVDGKHGLLVIVPANRRSFVMLLTRADLTVHPLRGISATALRRRTDAFIAAAQRGDAEVERLAARLGAAMVPESLRAELRELTRLTVQSGALRATPLEAVPVGQDLLGEILAIDHVGSIPAEVARAAGRRSPSARGDLRAGLVATLSISPRVAAAESIERIEQIEASAASPMRHFARAIAHLRDRDATPRAFVELCENVDVLQVVAHGIRLRDDPLVRSLALAPATSRGDGILRASHLPQSPKALPALSFWSTCRIGAGKTRRGDGELRGTLPGWFLDHGARAVVVSVANAYLNEQTELADAFHAQIVAGRSPARAMRSARASGRGRSRWRHALVQVHGDGQRALVRD